MKRRRDRHGRFISSKSRRSRRNPRKWIAGAIKRPGALRRKFAKMFGLKPTQKIPKWMYDAGYKRAQYGHDTRLMRRINLARQLAGFSKKRRGKVVRGVSFRPGRRRKVANPRRRRRRVRIRAS